MYLFVSVLLQMMINKFPILAESIILFQNQLVRMLPKKKANLEISHNVKGMGARG